MLIMIKPHRTEGKIVTLCHIWSDTVTCVYILFLFSLSLSPGTTLEHTHLYSHSSDQYYIIRRELQTSDSGPFSSGTLCTDVTDIWDQLSDHFPTCFHPSHFIVTQFGDLSEPMS